MAQVTELKVYGTMGGLYGRSFAGKTEDIPSGGIDVEYRVEDLRLIRTILKTILVCVAVFPWL